MKFVICAALICLIATFNIVTGDRDDPPCDVDKDCKWDECCVLDFAGDRKICRDIGDDLGDPCGGPYFCGDCGRSLICTPVLDAFPEPNGCSHPANGTCEWRKKGARRG